jgi:hypothetical protein
LIYPLLQVHGEGHDEGMAEDVARGDMVRGITATFFFFVIFTVAVINVS